MKRANQQCLFNFLSRPQRVFSGVSVLQLRLIHFSICDGRWTIASEHLPRCVYCENKKSESLRLWYMCSNAAFHPNTMCKWLLHASAMSSNRKVFDRVIPDSTARRTYHAFQMVRYPHGRELGQSVFMRTVSFEALGRQSWIWMRAVHNYGWTNWFTTWMRADAADVKRNGDA